MVTVRPFRPGDTSAFLSLVETVFDEPRDSRWFSWKFEANPYVDHVPIVVAEADDRVVGARPFLALRMRVAGDAHLALEPVDAMVHPDHRRRGVFTAMTEYAIDRYESSDASFFFNFPNAAAAAGNRELGWEKVGDRGTYYRFADPGRVADMRGLPGGVKAAAAAVKPASTGYVALREAFAPHATNVSVRRASEDPATVLAATYRERPPEKIHALRDETFYDWRLRNPDWRYETYVVEDDPSAAMVVGTSVDPPGEIVKITDVLPVGDERSANAFAALLRRVLADHDDATLVVAPPVSNVGDVLADFGFLCDRAYPLRAFATATRHYARPLADGWQVSGLDLRDESNWALSFVEHDTS